MAVKQTKHIYCDKCNCVITENSHNCVQADTPSILGTDPDFGPETDDEVVSHLIYFEIFDEFDRKIDLCWNCLAKTIIDACAKGK